MNIKLLLTLIPTLFLSIPAAHAVILVQTNDPGYYNNSIGNLLNLSNNGGLDNASQPFPVSNDSTASFPTAPNLSAASSILGNWLTNPASLNSFWSANPISIPNGWAVGTEVAVIYQFDTLSATNVVASFGVDNGIFAWLDGAYLFGARGPGSFTLGEYVLNLGNFDAGTHYLQLLLEDHGVTNGYAVQITADQFTPQPPTPTVAEPGTFILMLSGIGLLLQRKRKFTNPT